MIVLDTHVWIWWISGHEKLSAEAQSAIDEAIDTDAIRISTFSTWEVALLVAKGRLKLSLETRHWIGRTRALPCVQFVPLDNRVAIDAVELPGEFHSDPADRIIVATARVLDAPLVTVDSKIHQYSHVKTIW